MSKREERIITADLRSLILFLLREQVTAKALQDRIIKVVKQVEKPHDQTITEQYTFQLSVSNDVSMTRINASIKPAIVK